MTIYIGWLVERQVSYFYYQGDITVEELHEAVLIAHEFLEQCERPLLHTIQNTEELGAFPNNLGILVREVKASLSHPKMGWMLSVGIKNPLTRTLASLVSSIAKTRHRIYDSDEEALAFLAYVDVTLEHLKDMQPPKPESLLYYVEGNKRHLIG